MPPKTLRKFIGVDGESGRIGPEQDNRYLLLRVGTEAIISPDRSTKLSTIACLDFLASVTRRDTIYVGFGFDYDVTMILSDLTPEEFTQLLDRESRRRTYISGGKERETTTPFFWNGYAIDYFPRKHLSVTHPGGARFTVYDVIGFFQTSFVNALEIWNAAPTDEIERMRGEKALRDTFAELTNDTINYNARECDYLASLMEEFRASCIDAGYVPRRWEGAGALAEAMLQREKVPKKPELKSAVFDYARKAYYGGRFEVSRIGAIPNVTEYDIASAYPYAMTQLPCFADGHGEWTSHAHHQSCDPYEVCVHRIWWRTTNNFGPFPFRRKNGSICYPSNGRGFYWSTEYEVARTLPGTEILKGEGWGYTQFCEHESPYAFIPDVYRERKRIGKSGRGMILKLGLNSLYGKSAQSIGRPAWGNPVVAGLITSITRARMLNVIKHHDKDIVMIATDGIYLADGVKLNPKVSLLVPNPGLGDWEEAPLGEIFILQPGMYWTHDGHAKVKSRGIPQRLISGADAQRRFEQAFAEKGMQASVDVDMSIFYGARLALHLNRDDLRGQWRDTTRKINFNANYNKRDFALDGTYSQPYPFAYRDDYEAESTPYPRSFGYEFNIKTLILEAVNAAYEGEGYDDSSIFAWEQFDETLGDMA